MATDIAPRPSDAEVIASVDDDQYLIADISEDGAWLSIGVQEAPSLRSWR